MDIKIKRKNQLLTLKWLKSSIQFDQQFLRWNDNQLIARNDKQPSACKHLSQCCVGLGSRQTCSSCQLHQSRRCLRKHKIISHPLSNILLSYFCNNHQHRHAPKTHWRFWGESIKLRFRLKFPARRRQDRSMAFHNQFQLLHTTHILPKSFRIRLSVPDCLIFEFGQTLPLQFR